MGLNTSETTNPVQISSFPALLHGNPVVAITMQCATQQFV